MSGRGEGRRGFIAAALALVSVGRRVWAQTAGTLGPTRYAPLTRPVTIPLKAVTQPWHPVPFVAEGISKAQRRVLVSGVLFRTDNNLSALCVTCPHEQCHVDLVTDAERLAKLISRPGSAPLFECGCHFSVFDAADNGVRLSGEAPRGLYLFKVAGVRDGIVEITEIEEVALSEV